MQKEFNDLRTRLGEATKAAMITIVQNNAEKTSKWREDKSVLNQGHWYPSDYIRALQHWKMDKRITLFKEKRFYEFGYASSDVFNKSTEGKLEFIAKKTISASAALAAAIEKLGVYDCGMVCQLARYKALEKIIGMEKFNRLFDAQKGAALNIGYKYDVPNQPMRLFIEFTAEREHAQALQKGVDIAIEYGEVGNRPVKVGQLVLFNGVPNYQNKHPFGEALSWNVICIDDTPKHQLFSGFGLNPKGCTEMEIYKVMIDNYNQPPSHRLFMLEKDCQYMEGERRRLSIFTESNVTANAVSGFDAGGVQDFILEHVDQLINTPLEDIKPALIKNYPRPKCLIEWYETLSEVSLLLNMK